MSGLSESNMKITRLGLFAWAYEVVQLNGAKTWGFTRTFREARNSARDAWES